MIQRDETRALYIHSGKIILPDVPYYLMITDELIRRSLREGPNVLLKVVENEALNITDEVLASLPTKEFVSEVVYNHLAIDLKDVYQTHT